MSEEELNRIVKEHYGFTIDELDDDVAYWSIRYCELNEKYKQLKSVLDEIREKIKPLIPMYGKEIIVDVRVFEDLLQILDKVKQ